MLYTMVRQAGHHLLDGSSSSLSLAFPHAGRAEGKKNLEEKGRGGGRREACLLSASGRRVGQGGGRRLEEEGAIYRHSQQTRTQSTKPGIVLNAEEVKRNFYL